MAGRPPKLDHTREEFLREIDSAKTLVATVNGLPRKIKPSNHVGIHPKYVLQVVELAFMGVVSAWEEFLERTLTRYVARAVTNSGYSPSHKFGSANSITHAYELLSQIVDYDPQRNYLKVNDPGWVRRTADFFFCQHPYGCLSNKEDLLKAANSIRNRVAHNSEKCRADFNERAVWFIQPQNDTLKQGFGPGMLLTEEVKRHFGYQMNQGQSHFDAYMLLYQDLAVKIVPV